MIKLISNRKSTTTISQTPTRWTQKPHVPRVVDFRPAGERCWLQLVHLLNIIDILSSITDQILYSKGRGAHRQY